MDVQWNNTQVQAFDFNLEKSSSLDRIVSEQLPESFDG